MRRHSKEELDILRPVQARMSRYEWLEQRIHENWWVGGDRDRFHAEREARSRAVQTVASRQERDHPPTILLSERDPVLFLAGFVAACQADCPLFLGNPDWGDREWQQVFEQVQPDLMWGDASQNGLTRLPNLSAELTLPPNRIMIPTGGSSGQVKFAVHTWETLMASVEGFRQHFGVDAVHSYCVLPLYHVSGLMQFLRSLISGGQFAIQPFKTLVTGQIAAIDPADWFISLVPTQLQRLFSIGKTWDAATWLSQFRAVLLGGGAAWTDLLEQARTRHIPLALTYGMTETASQIATLKPEEFLQGSQSCGRVLPHASIQIEQPDGSVVGPNQMGSLRIQAKSLALGYFAASSSLSYGHKALRPSPQTNEILPPTSDLSPRTSRVFSGQIPLVPIQSEAGFQPDDLGFLDEQGYLHIVGRNSHKMITGGENVFPEEVEAVIRATGLVADICVLGLPDQEWGQVVTAVYVPLNPALPRAELQQLQAAIAPRLSPYKQPKRWIALDQLPRNAQGKISRDRLQACLETDGR